MVLDIARPHVGVGVVGVHALHGLAPRKLGEHLRQGVEHCAGAGGPASGRGGVGRPWRAQSQAAGPSLPIPKRQAATYRLHGLAHHVRQHVQAACVKRRWVFRNSGGHSQPAGKQASGDSGVVTAASPLRRPPQEPAAARCSSQPPRTPWPLSQPTVRSQRQGKQRRCTRNPPRWGMPMTTLSTPMSAPKSISACREQEG